MRSDRELMQTAFHSLANWMETGDVTLSKVDVTSMDKTVKVKKLNEDQLMDVARLRELAANLPQVRVIIRDWVGGSDLK